MLTRIVAEHGLGAIGVFHGTGAFQDALGSSTLRRLKKAFGTDQLYSTATVDAVAKTLVAEQMAGTPLLIPNIDEDHGRLLVFVGINPVISHGHATMFSNPIERIRAARRRGRGVHPRPALDGDGAALRPPPRRAAGHRLRRVRPHHPRAAGRPAIDETELDRRATGLDAIGDGRGAASTPATASALTGVPVDAARHVRRCRASGRATGHPQRDRVHDAPSGNVTEWLAWSLMVLTDSFDQPGGMWFNPGYFTHLERFETLPPAAPSEPSPPSRPDIARSGGEWPAALIADEIEAGRLRALIVAGANLLTALPGAAAPHRRPRSRSTPSSCSTCNTTARPSSATHVFACAGQLERADVLPLELNANAVYQHYTEPVVPPRDDRPPMWQTIARIGSGIGLDVIGSGTDPLTVTTDDMLARLARGSALERLRAAGDVAIEGGPAYDWVGSRLPKGRWDLAPQPLVAQLAALGAPTSLVLTPRRTMKRMNWQHFREGERHDVLVHPVDAAAAGVTDGELVDVTTATGSIRVPVRITDDIVPGAVSIGHGLEAANVNTLIDRHDLDPLTGMARLSGVPVAICPA